MTDRNGPSRRAYTPIWRKALARQKGLCGKVIDGQAARAMLRDDEVRSVQEGPLYACRLFACSCGPRVVGVSPSLQTQSASTQVRGMQRTNGTMLLASPFELSSIPVQRSALT